MPNLAAHFTTTELGVDDLSPFDPVYLAAQQTAQLLEAVRAAIGAPLRVTSGYRSGAHNAEVGGVNNSQHLTGNAADVLPVGKRLGDAYDAFQRANQAGLVPDFGQAIFYPFPLPPGHGWGHIHLSTTTGTNSFRKVLIATDDQAGGVAYNYPEPALVASMPRDVSAAGTALMLTLPFLVVVAIILLILYARSH